MYWRLPGRSPDLTRRRCRAVAERYARHPQWRDVLAAVIPGVDGNDRPATARALWAFVHRHVAFQPEVGEQIQTPATTIRRLMGDCDDQHALLLALYLSVALPARGALLRLDHAGRDHIDGVRAFHIWTWSDPSSHPLLRTPGHRHRHRHRRRWTGSTWLHHAIARPPCRDWRPGGGSGVRLRLVRLGGGRVGAETVHPSITFGQSPADAVRRGLTIQQD